LNRLATALGVAALFFAPVNSFAQQLDPGAMCLAGTGRFATDYTVCTAALASKKYQTLERTALYRHRAKTQRYMNQCEGALKDIDESLKLVEWSVAAWAERSQINQCLGDIDSALADANRGLEFNAFDFQVWKQRGIAEFYLAQFNKADTSLSRSIELNSYNAEALSFRALAAFANDNFEQAAWDFNAVNEQKFAWDMTLAWFALSVIRSGRESSAVFDAAGDDDGVWPTALIRWLETAHAADDSGSVAVQSKAQTLLDSLNDPRRTISALYFIGAMESLRGDNVRARQRFKEILQKSSKLTGQPAVEGVLAARALEKLSP